MYDDKRESTATTAAWEHVEELAKELRADTAREAEAAAQRRLDLIAARQDHELKKWDTRAAARMELVIERLRARAAAARIREAARLAPIVARWIDKELRRSWELRALAAQRRQAKQRASREYHARKQEELRARGVDGEEYKAVLSERARYMRAWRLRRRHGGEDNETY